MTSKTQKSSAVSEPQVVVDPHAEAGLPDDYETVPQAAPAPQVGRRSDIDEKSVVELLKASNPKRAGGVSRARFDLYRTGMTVGEYLDAAFALEKDKSYGRKRFRYLADIRWDTERSFIRLHPAGTVLSVAEDDGVLSLDEANQILATN